MNVHPNSLAAKSAQWMTDARAIEAMIHEMEKRPDKRATADEKTRLLAIYNRMPPGLQTQLRPVMLKLGFAL